MNDIKLGTFQSPVTNEISTWSINGALETHLYFQKTMIDKHGDQMGFAILTVPINTIKRESQFKLRSMRSTTKVPSGT